MTLLANRRFVLHQNAKAYNLSQKTKKKQKQQQFLCSNLCNFSCIGVAVIIIARSCCQHWWVGVAVTLSIALHVCPVGNFRKCWQNVVAHIFYCYLLVSLC